MRGCVCFLVYSILFTFIAYKRCEAAGKNICGDSEKLPCDNLECIPRDGWCDVAAHCSDGSDEKYCKRRSWFFDAVPDNKCGSKHFVCDDGLCVPAVARCDGLEDCYDDSDEKNCETTTATSTTRNDSSAFNAGNKDFVSEAPTQSTPSTSTTSGYYSGGDHGEPSTRASSTVTVKYPAASYTPPLSYAETADHYANRHKHDSVDPNAPYTPVHYYDPNWYDRRSSHQSPQTHPRSSDTEPSQHFTAYPYPSWPPAVTSDPRNTPYSRNKPYSWNTPRQHGNSRTTRYGVTSTTQRWSQVTSTTPRWSQVTPSPATRSPNDQSRLAPLSHAQPQRPVLIPSLSVLNPPKARHPHQTRSQSSSAALPRFYFSKNYTYDIAYNYVENVERAKQWLIGLRDRFYSWEEDTPRALVALSLITNTFTSNVTENDLMKKKLQLYFASKLLRSKEEPLSVTRLSSNINALLATCQNPRDFLGIDLVEKLYKYKYGFKRPIFSPFVFLTLCLANSSLSSEEIQNLERQLDLIYPDEISKDRYVLTITALACILQQKQHEYEFRSHMHELRGKLHHAVHHLISQIGSDGSFGSIYSTAIAAQAIMSVNSSSSWDARPTLDYLARSQSEDGSFGDMLATYYAIPALSGRSLLHIRNTRCDHPEAKIGPPTPQDILDRPPPYKTVLCSLKVAYPEKNGISLQLTIPEDVNVFDTMRVAAYLDPRFNFSYKSHLDEVEIHTISKISNDPERGLYWNLYVLKLSDRTVNLKNRDVRNIKKVIPKDSEEVLFWYLSTEDTGHLRR